MSVLEFIASVIQSVSWPLVAVVIVVILRAEIKSLANKLIERFGDLTELSGMGATAKFEHKLSDLVSESAKLHSDSNSAPADDSQSSNDADGGSVGDRTAGEVTGPAEPTAITPIEAEFLANVLPREPLLTIVDAYEEVAESARGALRRKEPESGDVNEMALGQIVEQLHTDRAIDPHLGRVLDDLRQTRNQAVHRKTVVTRQAADIYDRVAKRVCRYFDTL